MAGMLEVLLPFTPYLALILRIWFGASAMLHGYPKVKTRAAGASDAAQKMGAPRIVGPLAMILEFGGGIFLIVGLIVPIVCLLYMIFFAAITLSKKVKGKATYILGQGSKYELDIFYFMTAVTLLFLGAGAFSLDSLLRL